MLKSIGRAVILGAAYAALGVAYVALAINVAIDLVVREFALIFVPRSVRSELRRRNPALPGPDTTAAFDFATALHRVGAMTDEEFDEVWRISLEDEPGSRKKVAAARRSPTSRTDIPFETPGVEP